MVRSKPDAAMLDGFASAPDEALFLSALTQGDIRKGVEKLIISLGHPAPPKFAPVAGARVARRVGSAHPSDLPGRGRLLAQAGRPVAAIDSLLAFTALHHDLRLDVTKMVCNSIAELFRDQMNPKRRACDSRNVGSGP